MKLVWQLKYAFNWHLKELRKKNEFQKIIKILENILDENQSNESLKTDLLLLQTLIDSKAPQHLEALFILGICYQNGLGVTKDAKRAVELYQLAANQGHAGAQNNLGFCYHGIGVTRDEKRAVELYQLAVNQGYANAQRNLGFCYHEGIGVTKDAKRTVELYQLAANQGDALSQCNLGGCYRDGIGVTKDERRAAALYQLAASQDLVFAQCNLGFCYQHGIGVIKDEKRAVEFYQLAAKQGHALSQCNLGGFYYQGIGVTKDAKRSVLLYQVAALQNDENAVANLNQILARNNQFPKLQEAVPHYRKLVWEGNDVSALTTLAFCYQMGCGTDINLKLASKFYEEALQKGAECDWDLLTCYQAQVKSGISVQIILDFYNTLKQKAEKDPKAASLLAYLYENGAIGLEQNLYTALQYYEKSKNAEPGYSNEKIRLYTPRLNTLRKACQDVYNPGISALITEYAFENEKP